MAQIVVEHRDDLQRGRITAVSSGGWRVEICGPNVTVPSQDSAGKSLDDLGGLLIAAYTMAGTAINMESARWHTCGAPCLSRSWPASSTS